ncbi:MAG: type II secretion system F family protein [Desulfurococcales archaeon]|nr:type II secretion system F family protein [Desulfurococcales archaeon]
MALEGLRRRLRRLGSLLPRRRGARRAAAPGERLPTEPRSRVYRPARRLTLQDAIDVVAMSYFRGAAEKLVRTFELDSAIRRAGMRISPDMYAARLLLYTAVTAFLSAYFSLLIAVLDIAVAVKAIAILMLLMAPLIVFGMGLAYPSGRIGDRKSGVETELPFFAAYLTTMARGGVSVGKILERVSNLKIFRAIREEARMIVRDIRVFGKDPLSAIEANALEHPSPRYRDLMLGYVTSVRTGGDVLHYLEIRTQDIFTSRISELKTIAERMSMFTEVYVTVAVILTLVFYIFFTISAIFPTSGFGGGVAQLALFSFVFLPTITVLLLYMIHKAQPRTPIEFRAPYRNTLIIGAPLALVAFPIILYGTGGYQALYGASITAGSIIGLAAALSGSLIALALPGAATYIREKRRTRGLGRATANFLRDLAETRKTGLSPEKSIEMLADRDYGPLTPIVRRAAAALTLGMELEEALRRALRGFRDWLLLANFRFLADSIQVGGGTSETLDSLARYAHSLVEIEEELKRRLRSYIFMPYMGAILVVVSSLLVLGFTASTLTSHQAQTGPGALGLGGGATIAQQIPKIALLLTLGGVFNAWLMGLVAGKIQDSYLAAGFVHSIILTLISLAASALVIHTVPLQPPT